MKKRVFALFMVISMMLVAFAGCGGEEPASTTDPVTQTPADAADPVDPPADPAPAASANEKLVVGFAQIGQESGWRDAETASIQWYAAQNLDTIDLKFADARQLQENQIKSIKTFIDMGVDVIGLAPVQETGWESVFTEAKDAGIPIVLVDRMAAVSDNPDDPFDTDLFATFIGSDFIQEGKDAAIEMSNLLGGTGKIVQLEGSVGASAANDRKKGFEDEIAANHPGIEILESQTGEFTRAKGKEVMESFLKTYSNGEIAGVYGHNDDMVLGAIEAIKEAGLKPGVDIVTVSIDGVGGIFEAMAAGEANVTIECNPLLGPQFFDACQKLKNGEAVDKWIKSDEGIFRADTAEADLPTRQY